MSDVFLKYTSFLSEYATFLLYIYPIEDITYLISIKNRIAENPKIVKEYETENCNLIRDAINNLSPYIYEVHSYRTPQNIVAGENPVDIRYRISKEFYSNILHIVSEEELKRKQKITFSLCLIASNCDNKNIAVTCLYKAQMTFEDVEDENGFKFIRIHSEDSVSSDKLTKFGQQIIAHHSEDDQAENRFSVGDIVKYFKREKLQQPGNLYLYKILGFAKHTETQERLVIYQALYENDEMGVHFDIYARPYSMFMSKVDIAKYPNFKQVYRFEKYCE